MSKTTETFAGLRVVAFESRMAGETAELIRRYGGEPTVAPSMREVPLDGNPAASAFAEAVVAGRVDVVILLTGVGTRALVRAASEHVAKDELLAALSRCILVARGPKPVAALRELKLPIAHTVPEPNTWRELLGVLDESLPVDGRRVAVQEYGISNPHLIAGLEARGAKVMSVPVYRWDLPEDTRPLQDAVGRVARGEADVVLFTNRAQVDHVVQMAARLQLGRSLREALDQVVVCSIGPTASEALWYHGMPVDVVPEHPKLAHLVREAARRSTELLKTKRSVARVVVQGADRSSAAQSATASPLLAESRFLKACRLQRADTTPIWIMRQAGRYLPEYRAIREKFPDFLEMCKQPEVAAEVTLQPVRRLGVDAAILFADILPVLEPMGVDLEYAKGEGPVIHNPIRESADVDRLAELESAETLDFVFQAVRLAREALDPAIPLLGFAGAPFTLASYAIEGGSSRHFQHTKVLMYRDPEAWRALMERLARSLVKYLSGQMAAGVQAVQLFDSWVGSLGPDDYRTYVLPYSRQVIEGLGGTVPVIHFATGNPALLPLIKEAGGTVIGLDWRVELGEAWSRLGFDVAVQGNLDPLALFADRAEIRRRAGAILASAAGRPGHIFNLGHGILPQTPVDHAVALVEAVHELGAG